jgi:hypothetical protein
MSEVTKPIPYVEAERPPTPKELKLWSKAQVVAKRVKLRAYAMQLQWKQIKQIHEFAVANQIDLGEPELPELADRMFAALHQVETLKDLMCGVNDLELGIRVSSGGDDLDIVEPAEQEGFGWVLPAILGAVVLVGIVARWYSLEFEIEEVSEAYNGVIRRADKSLCEDKGSEMCKAWKKDKAERNFYKRETLIGSVKDAVSTVGKVAKKGGSLGIALAIPLLLWMYLPRGRKV